MTLDFADPMWEVVPANIRVHLPKRSEEYALRILRDYSPEPELVPQPAKVKAPSRGESLVGGTRRAHYDYAEIARLFETGMLVKEIAAAVKCSPTTVRAALKATRPEGYTGKSGPKVKTHCVRGHDMAVHGRPAKGGRYCSECKRERERVRPDRDRIR